MSRLTLCLNPPFKSDQNYKVLFKKKDGAQAASQIQAFEDTWPWDQEDEAVYADLSVGALDRWAVGRVHDILVGFVGSVLPEGLESPGADAAPQGDDAIGSFLGPKHAGGLQSYADDGFAARLDDA